VRSRHTVRAVSRESTIDPAKFLACLQPLLAGRDLQGLTELLKTRFTDQQITALFANEDPDVRKVAALAFSLVGTRCGLSKLAPLLRDADPMVNQMAEHAMWSVWFRSGANCDANRELCRGTKALNQRDFDLALEHIDRAIACDPGFAEAYNQRAIVNYLQERYEESIEDCQRVLERMPMHFGAWAGMGHCHAHLGRLTDALACYEKALAINPHFDCVRQAVEELRLRDDQRDET
jgi:tetratricopeptide (TPR) repeat protein